MGVWFVIPAHGRAHVSAVAFAGIAWTLAALDGQAEALVVADDENLDIAREFGLRTLERRNLQLGRKWNDGIQHACENGATHVVTCGSDDWVHPDLIRAHLERATPTSIMCSRASVVVAPDGHEAVSIMVKYAGGDGVRMLPRELLGHFRYRPYIDDRNRALDGAMFDRLTRGGSPFEWVYNDLHRWQIVDFKSAENLTGYEKFPRCEHKPRIFSDPLTHLGIYYPPALVDRARELFESARRT